MVRPRYTEQVLSHTSYKKYKYQRYRHIKRKERARINKRKVGSRHEEQAAAFLEKQGLKILEHNFFCRGGEIDLVAKDGKYLVFVEVKYRATTTSGEAAAAVDFKKQRRISRAAQFYLLRYGYGEPPCRFDVVAIDGDEIQWIRNAFDYCG